MASKMIKIWKHKNAFSSDLSSFKYNEYCNGILFVTNYSDLSFLILSKNELPSSSLASRLAVTLIFDLPPFLKYAFWHHNYVFGVGNGNCMVKIIEY